MAQKKPPSPKAQLKEKQAALETSRQQQQAEVKLLNEELKIREELEGKIINQKEKEAEALRLKQSFLEQQEKILKEIFALELKLHGTAEDTKKEYIEINKTLKAGNELLDQQAGNLKETQDAAGAIGGLMEQAVGHLGISVKQSDMWSSSFAKIGKGAAAMVKDLKSGNRSMKDFAKSGAAAAASMFTISDFLGNMVASSLEVARNLRSVKVNLVGAGFATKKVAALQKGYTKDLQELNISGAEYAGTVATMYGNNAKLGKTLQGNAGIFSKLSRLGINTADSMTFLNSRMFEFGEQSPKALQDSLGDLIAIDDKLGQVRGTALKEFTANLTRLNQYGPRSKQVFSELSVVAEKTGLSMSKILDVTAKFDTFEGAANMAQKLNVALNTSISSMELVGKTDVERAQIISQRLQESGVDLNNISPQLARVLQQAGIDLGDMKRLAGADLANVSSEAAKVSKDNTTLLTDVAKDAANAIDPLDLAATKVKIAFGLLATKLNKGLMPIVDAIIKMDDTEILATFGVIAAFGSALGLLMRRFRPLLKLLGKGGGGDVAKAAAEVATKGGGKKVAATVAGAGSAAALTKMAPSAVGKGVAKKIPGLSLILGTGFAISRAMDGDYVGAAGELVAGGLATFLPGIGTAGAVAIEAALIGRDVAYETGALKGSQTSGANQLRDLAVAGAGMAGSVLGPMGTAAAAGLAAKYVPGEDTSGMQNAVQGTASAQANARSAAGNRPVELTSNINIGNKNLAKVTQKYVRQATTQPNAGPGWNPS